MGKEDLIITDDDLIKGIVEEAFESQGLYPDIYHAATSTLGRILKSDETDFTPRELQGNSTKSLPAHRTAFHRLTAAIPGLFESEGATASKVHHVNEEALLDAIPHDMTSATIRAIRNVMAKQGHFATLDRVTLPTKIRVASTVFSIPNTAELRKSLLEASEIIEPTNEVTEIILINQHHFTKDQLKTVLEIAKTDKGISLKTISENTDIRLESLPAIIAYIRRALPKIGLSLEDERIQRRSKEGRRDFKHYSIKKIEPAEAKENKSEEHRIAAASIIIKKAGGKGNVNGRSTRILAMLLENGQITHRDALEKFATYPEYVGKKLDTLKHTVSRAIKELKTIIGEDSIQKAGKGTHKLSDNFIKELEALDPQEIAAETVRIAVMKEKEAGISEIFDRHSIKIPTSFDILEKTYDIDKKAVLRKLEPTEPQTNPKQDKNALDPTDTHPQTLIERDTSTGRFKIDQDLVLAGFTAGCLRDSVKIKRGAKIAFNGPTVWILTEMYKQETQTEIDQVELAEDLANKHPGKSIQWWISEIEKCHERLSTTFPTKKILLQTKNGKYYLPRPHSRTIKILKDPAIGLAITIYEILRANLGRPPRREEINVKDFDFSSLEENIEIAGKRYETQDLIDRTQHLLLTMHGHFFNGGICSTTNMEIMPRQFVIKETHLQSTFIDMLAEKSGKTTTKPKYQQLIQGIPTEEETQEYLSGKEIEAMKIDVLTLVAQSVKQAISKKRAMGSVFEEDEIALPESFTIFGKTYKIPEIALIRQKIIDLETPPPTKAETTQQIPLIKIERDETTHKFKLTEELLLRGHALAHERQTAPQTKFGDTSPWLISFMLQQSTPTSIINLTLCNNQLRNTHAEISNEEATNKLLKQAVETSTAIESPERTKKTVSKKCNLKAEAMTALQEQDPAIGLALTMYEIVKYYLGKSTPITAELFELFDFSELGETLKIGEKKYRTKHLIPRALKMLRLGELAALTSAEQTRDFLVQRNIPRGYVAPYFKKDEIGQIDREKLTEKDIEIYEAVLEEDTIKILTSIDQDKVLIQTDKSRKFVVEHRILERADRGIIEIPRPKRKVNAPDNDIDEETYVISSSILAMLERVERRQSPRTIFEDENDDLEDLEEEFDEE